MELFTLAIDALNRSGARYLVVGGVAGTLHGIRRTTFDLDVMIEFGPRSTGLAIQSLLDAGFATRLPINPLQLADANTREGWVREKNLKAVPFFFKRASYFVVDVFAYHPLDFEELYRRSRIVVLQHLSTRIASIDDLIALKELAGRAKDLLDIEELRTIKSSEKKT